MKIPGMQMFGLVAKRRLTTGFVICLLMLVTSQASAHEPDVVARKEISYLLSYLGSSDCRFYRNGSWHASSSAVRHLNRKYEYLLKRRLVSTAESFIELAATKSSRSGDEYLVKCGDATAVKSSAWLTQELARYRAAPK
jgi:hypothetical protein